MYSQINTIQYISSLMTDQMNIHMLLVQTAIFRQLLPIYPIVLECRRFRLQRLHVATNLRMSFTIPGQ